MWLGAAVAGVLPSGAAPRMMYRPGTTFWNSEKSSEAIRREVCMALPPLTFFSTGAIISVSASGLVVTG